MSYYNLYKLSDEDMCKLIDVVEDLPGALNKKIKININNPEINPKLRKGNKPNISIYSSLIKFFKEGSINIINNPELTHLSDFQQKFCTCGAMLEMSPRFNEIRANKYDRQIKLLLMYPFYDPESAIKLEQAMAEFMKVPAENLKMSLAEFFTMYLVPTKCIGYDFYHFLVFNEFTDNADSDEFIMMQTLNKNPVRGTSANDFAIIMYLYFKELGVEKVATKYGFTDRYYYVFKKNAPEMADAIMEKFKMLVLQDTTSEEASSLLRNNTGYKDISSREDYTNLRDSDKMFKVEGGIVQSDIGKDIFKDNDDIPSLIRNISKESMLDYLDDNTLDSHISFYISDNDLGILKNMKDLSLGMFYDEFNNDMKYFGNYQGDYYVFHKNNNEPGKIFGLSVRGNPDKKIMSITIPKAYHYRNVAKML